MNQETEELVGKAVCAIEELYDNLTKKDCNLNRDSAFNLLTWREGLLDKLFAARNFDRDQNADQKQA